MAIRLESCAAGQDVTFLARRWGTLSEDREPVWARDAFVMFFAELATRLSVGRKRTERLLDEFRSLGVETYSWPHVLRAVTVLGVRWTDHDAQVVRGFLQKAFGLTPEWPPPQPLVPIATSAFSRYSEHSREELIEELAKAHADVERLQKELDDERRLRKKMWRDSGLAGKGHAQQRRDYWVFVSGTGL